MKFYVLLNQDVMEERLKKNENENFISVNPKKEPLTIEKLKELTGWDHLTDEEATEVIFSVKAFVRILMETQTGRDIRNNETEYNLKQAA